MPFTKGEGGRKPGAKNKVTLEMQEFCQNLVSSEEYRKYLSHRFMVGQLPPALEQMIWHYALGKPIERQELTGAEGKELVITWQ